MTAIDYIQLRAFARYDGLKLFGLWIASFACYMVGLREPGLDVVGLVLALVTPFYAARLLRRFRDEGLEGVVSFGRGWAYVLFLFFYASLLFAIAQFAYFMWMDKGFFVSALTSMLNDPAMMESMKRMGMEGQMSELMTMLGTMRPIDLVLNILTSNLMIGCIVGLPIALVCKRERPIEH
jgi:hypothetical protein